MQKNRIGERVAGSPAVIGLLLVNLVVFIAQLVLPGVAEALGLPGEASEIVTRPWTLLTVLFLHENAGHLIVMMLVLLVVGVALEEATSARHVVLVYVVGGLAGSVAVVAASAFVESGQLLAGSSAAVFAIAAAFAAVRPDATLFGSKATRWAAALLLVNVPFAFVSLLGSVAHLAGLGAGAVLGYRFVAAASVEAAASSSSRS